MFEKLSNSVATIAPYIYNKGNFNALRMMVAHSIDVIAAGVNTIVPLLLVSHFNTQQEIEKTDSPNDWDWNKEWPLVLYMSAMLGAQLLPKIRNFLIDSVRANVQKELTYQMVEKAYAIELDHFLTTRTGEFAQALTKNYSTIDKVLPSFFSEIVPITFEIIGITGVLGYKYGLVASLPPTILAAFITGAIVGEVTAEEVRKQCTDMSYMAYGVVIETINNYQVAHQFGNVAHELKKANRALTKSADLYESNHHKDDRNALLLSVINSLGFFGSLVYASLFPPTMNFGILDFALTGYFFTRLNAHLDVLPKSISALHTAIVDSEKVVSFLHRRSAVEDIAQPKKLNLIQSPRIEFRNVSFSYGKKEILDDVSFIINPGEKFAIVGPTGTGKSTIIKLLLRFYSLAKGQILINGIDIATLSAESLRQNIAVVAQDSPLFNDTVKENIRYGDLTAQDHEILEVAEYSELVTKKTKAKLEESAGQQGNKLSGGEKQRANIARALLKGGYIYLLDEPTSALDAKTESEVQSTLDRLTASVTTLVVTHRLNTIINADNILYLENGKVSEQGTFDALMGRQGAFFNQFQVQCADLGIDINRLQLPNRKQCIDHDYEFWLQERHQTRMMRSRPGYDLVNIDEDELLEIDASTLTSGRSINN